MDSFFGRRILMAVLCVSLAWCVGCASFPPTLSWPFWGLKSDKIAGITPPKERIAILRQMAKRAASASPDEQEQISAHLAAAYEKEDDPLIRAEIVRALAGYSTESAALVLDKATSDAQSGVRIAACQAWGRRGGPDAPRLLGSVLAGDVEMEVRLAAARALGGSRDPAAAAALGQALEDRDPAMQYCAVQSLRQCTGEDFGDDVNRWRQYVKGEKPSDPEPVSIAERFWGLF